MKVPWLFRVPLRLWLGVLRPRAARSSAWSSRGPWRRWARGCVASRWATRWSRRATWVERGELESVIDRRFTLSQTAQAHRYVETGHKQGHVVVSVR